MSLRSLITCIVTILLLCLAGTFAWAAVPTITSIAPPSAVIGMVVTITGTNLGAPTAVTFNGIAAVNITDNTDTTLKAMVPEGATSGELVVITTTGGTVTNPYDFIILSGLKTNTKDNAEMLWVSGATFTMGSADDVGWTDEHPAHQVTLSGYWIYKNVVTVAQYRTFCAATNHQLPPIPQPKVDDPVQFDSNLSWAEVTDWDDAALQQHPIVNIKWDDAKAYADWAGVALPTEAQWEYAARGPQGNNYPWGGIATKGDLTNGWDVTKCATRENSSTIGKSTWPVGSFPAGASWCGAQDMAGNVYQWCADWYSHYTAAAVTDPTGPDRGMLYRGMLHVHRGGPWGSTKNYSRGAGRGYSASDYYSCYIGFRCVSLSPGP
ncbi:MAG: SUMF1/EgtB/PvdO family nonheme iron enzyme [bacterium]